MMQRKTEEMFPLTIYWLPVHKYHTNIKNNKSFRTVRQNYKINGVIKTLRTSSQCSLYCMSSSCGVRGQ